MLAGFLFFTSDLCLALDLFAIKQCVALYNLFAACLLNLRAKLTALTRLYHEPGEKPNISGPTQIAIPDKRFKEIRLLPTSFS